MSSISSFLKKFLVASSVGRPSSHSPIGSLPVIGGQLPPFALRVLMTPSIESAVPRAVYEAELWLESVATWWQGDGDSEVTGSSMEVRRKCFAYAVKRPAALWDRNNLAGII